MPNGRLTRVLGWLRDYKSEEVIVMITVSSFFAEHRVFIDGSRGFEPRTKGVSGYLLLPIYLKINGVYSS